MTREFPHLQKSTHSNHYRSPVNTSWERISLCSPGWLQICNPLASTSAVLALQVCSYILRSTYFLWGIEIEGTWVFLPLCYEHNTLLPLHWHGWRHWLLWNEFGPKLWSHGHLFHQHEPNIICGQDKGFCFFSGDRATDLTRELQIWEFHKGPFSLACGDSDPEKWQKGNIQSGGMW